MPRKQREISPIGIYHVMIRGINKNNIFLDEDDYMTMQRVLSDAHLTRNNSGKVISDNDCSILAYALMPNHVHILLKEGGKTLSEIMKKIQDRYVWFYNTKNERTGHLFQDRFRSEPVKDEGYLLTLMRYINLNPVKGMLCERPEDYMYSSWREYLGMQVIMKVCDTQYTLNLIEYNELVEFVNNFVDDECMDMDSERFILTDKHAWEILQEMSGADNVEEFKQYNPQLQLNYLIEAITEHGLSVRQANRLSIFSRHRIEKEISIRNSAKGSDPLAQNFNRNLDPVERVIELIRDEKPTHQIVMAEKLGMSVYNLRKIIQMLIKEGRIERIPDKRWEFRCEN